MSITIQTKLAPFWKVNHLSGPFCLCVGLIMGPVLAFLIATGNWLIAVALVALIPVLLFLVTYPFAAVLIWLLLMPFFVVTPGVSSRYVYWMVHRALIPIALGLVILAHMHKLRKPRTIGIGSADLATVVFAAMVLVSILVMNPAPKSALVLAYDRLLIPLGMYWLIRLTAPRQRALQRLVPIAVFILFSQAVIGLLSWFAPQVLPRAWLSLQGLRTTGTLNNPAVYTTTLVFFSLITFHAAMQFKGGVRRAILLAAFSLGAVGVFLSFSRGSWLGALLVGIGLLLLYPKAMLRIGVILLVVMILLGSGALSNQMTWAADRLEDQGTIDARVVGMRASFGMVQAKPLVGWGYDNYDRFDRQFQVRTENHAINYDETSHNAWLTIMVEMGLIGFLIFVFPFVRWFTLTLKVRTCMPRTGFWSWPLLVMFWLVIGDFFVVNNFMDMRYFPFGLTLLWATLAFAANMVAPYLRPCGLATPAVARHATNGCVPAETR